MSRWGDPSDYVCRVLIDPENDVWKTVGTPEEAEQYPVHEIGLRYAISSRMLSQLYNQSGS